VTLVQPSLPAFVEPDPSDTELTLDERFRRFHEANPWVYKALLRYAREAVWTQRTKGRNRIRIGAKAVAERVRWDYEMQADDNEVWKVNNSYISRYARMMNEEDDLRGCFELRALKDER